MRYAPTSYAIPPQRAGRGALASASPHPRRWEAYALVGSGITSVLGLLLYSQGKLKAATALGVFAALGAATVGAVRILSEPA